LPDGTRIDLSACIASLRDFETRWRETEANCDAFLRDLEGELDKAELDLKGNRPKGITQENSLIIPGNLRVKRAITRLVIYPSSAAGNPFYQVNG
jgi:hypothetical protein